MRILIAEDDLASREFLRCLLAQYGECDAVIDGLEALDAIMLSEKENKPYNLICLDIMMPKVDGVRVLKAIRDLEKRKGIVDAKRAKVIMTTALNDFIFVQKAIELGCEAYVEKPINIVKLIDIINSLKMQFPNSFTLN